MAQRKTRNARTAVMLCTLVAAMVGLSFASVPLYRLFCQVTGYGGTPKVQVAASDQVSERTIKIQFDANTNPALPWRFRASQREVTVRLGEQALAFYDAKNLAEGPVTGRAIFNVTPFKAGAYFSKIDCFCFTEQTLTPGQEMPMPVQFYVDPEILNDPNTRDLHTITLSYTFYKADDEDDATPEPEKRADAGKSEVEG